MRRVGPLALLAALAGCTFLNDPDKIKPGADQTVPPTPTGITAVAGQAWVTLSWTPVSVADLDGYVVFAGSVSGDLVDVGRTSDPTYVVTGLPEVEHYFAVAALDRAENVSPPTAEVPATPDATAPTLAMDPPDGATGVNVNVDVVLAFSEAMSRATIETPGVVTVTRGDAGAVPTFTLSWDPGDQTAIVSFTADLQYANSYTVTVGAGARDLVGNALAPTSATFTTAAAPDTTRPTVSSTTPVTGSTGASPATTRTFSITFSEAMNQSLTQTAFQLLTVGGSDAAAYRGGTYGWTNGGRTLSYTLPGTTTFPNGALVTYSVGTGACDLAPSPNYLLATYSGNFKTAYQKSVTILGDNTNGYFDGYIISGVAPYTSTTVLFAGDANNNAQVKGFVSFPHTLLSPAPSKILSATLSLYQLATSGLPFDDLDTVTPRCFESKLYDCDQDLLLKHVSIGTSLTADDFSSTPLRSLGELTETTTVGWKSRSVTTGVADDVTNARGRTQIRLEFPVASDGDAVPDWVSFASAEYTTDTALRPKLEVTFEYP